MGKVADALVAHWGDEGELDHGAGRERDDGERQDEEGEQERKEGGAINNDDSLARSGRRREALHDRADLRLVTCCVACDLVAAR